MTKKDNLKMVRDYVAYAKTVDIHQTPTKGINSGVVGRALEMIIKNDLNNYNFNGVASTGRNDTTKKGYKIEIKTGAGELATIDRDGKIKSPLFSSDYIIYAPYADLDLELNQMFIVCDANEFYRRVTELGLTRLKMSTAMHRNSCLEDSEKWKDRISLQFNSGKKEGLLFDLLDEIGMSYSEFKAKVLGI